jgi:predicted nuclease with TOPRIM domain
MENQTGNLPQEKNKNSKALLYTIIGVLVALNAGLLYMWQKSGNEKEKVVTEKTAVEGNLKEKEAALADAEHLLKKFRADSATMASKNQELGAEVIQRKNELAQLVATLRASKTNSAKEVAQLRAKIQELTDQITKLEEQNAELKAQNDRLDAERTQLESENRSINEKNTQISSENRKMRQRLIGESVTVEPLKKRWITGKEAVTYKAKDVESFKTSFSIAENKNAEPGEKVIYVKITGPGGTTLTNGNQGGTFAYEGAESKFTYQFTTVFDGMVKPVDPTIWRPAEDLKPGSYTIELFCDGFKIGARSFSLK